MAIAVDVGEEEARGSVGGVRAGRVVDEQLARETDRRRALVDELGLGSGRHHCLRVVPLFEIVARERCRVARFTE